MKAIDLIKSMERLHKPFYSIPDIEKITGLSRKSVYVALSRLVDRGILERIGPGSYRPFNQKGPVEKMAASLYIPSYLSFESALSRHGVLNLVPYTLTFATTRKTKRLSVAGRDVEFRQIKKALFWGYAVQGGLYVARAEKAFLDLIYLASKGMATVDLDELDVKKLSMKTLKTFSRKFPGYTRRFLEKILSG